MSARLISIIGPPASGKTTLAELLAGDLPAEVIHEDYAGNPFLAESYLGREEFALQSQLYFLFSRLSQLNLQLWPAEGTYVSDYGFCQDAVYAGVNLCRTDLAVYRRFAAGTDRMVKAPDVFISLAGSEDMLLGRIAQRGREHERVFTREFLAGLGRAYDDVLASATCPVIEVDVGAVDITSDADLAKLLGRVREAMA